MIFNGKMNYSMRGYEDENIIVLDGISKMHLVPGWRININDKIKYHNLGKGFDINALKKDLR